MKTSLFQIEQEYLNLTEAIMEAEGVLTPEIEQSLIINEKQLTTKAVNYGFVVKQIEYNNAAIKAEMDRLNKLKKVNDNVIERLKKAISEAMNLYEVEEIKSEIMKINFRKSTAVVQEFDDVDIDALPDNLKTVKTTANPNLKEIGDVLKSGGTVDGFKIENRKSIQFK